MIRNRRVSVIASLLLMVVGVTAVFAIRGNVGATLAVVLQGNANSPAPRHAAPPFSEIHSASYVYYTLKQSTGFVLARAPKGTDGQPLGTPQPISHFGNSFGLRETDSVSSMQLSLDGRYLAINGISDHGEEVWIYDTQRMTLNLLPAAVMGNFLHWLPGTVEWGFIQHVHTFLYRPMFPLGPSAPMDGGSWNPGLWEVDASTGAHKNIDIGVPSAFLVDAAPSPDGSHIVYSTSAGQGMGSDVWMMKPDGSARAHLFHTSGGVQSIAGLFTWSPDGKNIAYELLSDSPTPFLPAGLWVMNNSGSQQRRLADTDGGHGFAPVWSPDSRSIAYVVRTNTNNRLADQTMQALQSAIAVVDVTSGRSTMVASSTQTGMQINVNPQWTADSSALIFTASNPINQVLGGTPRYWLAHINHIAGARSTAPTVGARFIAPPSLEPLSPAVPHVIAMGD